jgi:hypothetical protein
VGHTVRRQVHLLDEQRRVPERPLGAVVEDRVLSNRDAFLRTALVVLVLLTVPARAERQKVAVLEFEVQKGLKIDRRTFSGRVQNAARRATPDLFVMTQANSESLVRAAGKTLEQCEGQDKQAEGLRLRRQHDARRTWLSMVLAAGANETHAKWIAHGPPPTVLAD